VVAPYRSGVEQFLEHFSEQAAEIGSVKSPFHRKVLYSAAFDPLARAAYGTIGTHRDRFVELLQDVAQWHASERVSLPQLRFRLREAGRSRHRLYREATRRLDQWGTEGEVPISSSPSVSELSGLAGPTDHNHLKNSQYVHLFYSYRNNLVHEFREPGYGTDWSGKSTEPFYNRYINGPWELVFPVVFIAELYVQTLDGLKSHLLSNRINPYKQFEFGSLWRAK
jgi:hypothetical protein